MRIRSPYSAAFIILISYLTFLSLNHTHAQEETSISMKEAEELLNHSLNFDTVRPGLNLVGKGLMYYHYIILERHNKTYLLKYREEEKSLVVKASYSDLELETMKQNLLFMDKQAQFQIREMIRKEKWDLNLGEAIKGFYMKPVF